VLLYIASSLANRKRPDAAAGGRPLVGLVLYSKTVCARGLPKMETEMLIDLARKYEFLYDVGHKDYKNVAKKAEAWRDIAKVDQSVMYYSFIN
jgi:hypothetical protein